MRIRLKGFNSEDFAQVTIRDLNGNTMFLDHIRTVGENQSSGTIELSFLPAGILALQVKSGQFLSCQKIIKSN